MSSFEAENHQREIPAGTVLFMEGDAGREMFIIIKGSILLYQVVAKRLREDAEVMIGHHIREIARLSDGDYFGEMALLDHQPRSTCAVAITDTSCLVLDEANFGQVMATRPDFSLRLMREFSRRVRVLETKLRTGVPNGPASN